MDEEGRGNELRKKGQKCEEKETQKFKLPQKSGVKTAFVVE